VLFVWIVTAVLLKMTFKEYAQSTFTYSYDMYGMFWGASTTVVLIFGVVNFLYISSMIVYFSKHKYTDLRIQSFPVGTVITLLLELPVAIYIARKATVAVPCIFKYPATLLCCGRKRPAERLVTTIVLWVDLVVLQLILFQGYLIILTLSAAPFAVATNVMLVVLALSCLTNFFSLIYTIFAHLCTPSNQRVHSSSMVLRAVVVLPLLLMIMCHGVVIAGMGSVTNVDAKRNNALSFISSIATPVLLGVLSIFLKRFISAWLKWSPQGTEEVRDTSNGQDADDELLDP
ncbi:MAG: hypothetical protein MPL62_18055, partial [Alphaproteobacteria bacterium]|nr:hypothetical protein [Alphaproteobacteria bacterium]